MSHVLHFHALLELLEVPELLWSRKPSSRALELI